MMEPNDLLIHHIDVYNDIGYVQSYMGRGT